jgi:hypothetical protein
MVVIPTSKGVFLVPYPLNNGGDYWLIKPGTEKREVVPVL